MADWKKNRQKFQMPHDRVERCIRYALMHCCSNGGRQDR